MQHDHVDNSIDLDADGKISKKEIDLYVAKTKTQKNLAMASFALIALMTAWIFFTPEVSRIVRLMGLIETILFLLATIIFAQMGVSAFIARK